MRANPSLPPPPLSIIVTGEWPGEMSFVHVRFGREEETRGHSSRHDCFHLEQKREKKKRERERERESRFLLSTWLNLSSRGAAARLTKINLFSRLYLRGRNISATANERAGPWCVRGPPIATFAATPQQPRQSDMRAKAMFDKTALLKSTPT